jgi:hypothetical protein
VALGFGDLIHLLRTVDRLLVLEKRHGDLIERLGKDVQALADRLTRMESREEVLIVEARAAAATAASVAASGHLAELARQVGALQERTKRIDGQGSNLIQG